MAAITYLESLRSSLNRLMEQDGRVVVLGEDVLDPYGGAFKVTKGLSSRYPDRVLTTPISEAAIAGLTIGMAMRGMRPIAEIMFGDFITLAADQIVNHAAKYVGMYGDAVQISMVLRTPMGGGRGYGPTHSQSLEKMFLGLPMFHILAPSHFHHPGEMLGKAIASSQPVLFFENKLLYPKTLVLESRPGRLKRSELVDERGYPCVILENYSDERQPDVAVIAYGGASRLLEPLMEQLAAEEVWVRACLPGCLSPLPVSQIVQATRGARRFIVLEENSIGFGWSSEVATRIYDAYSGLLLGPVIRLGAAETVIPASKPLEEQVLISEEKIMLAISEVLAW